MKTRPLHFNLALFLDRLAAVLPGGVYALGGVLLVAKVFGLFRFPSPTAIVVMVLLLALVGGLAALAGLLTRAFSPGYAAAWLDLHNHAGGRILAGDPAALAAARVRPGASLCHLASRLIWPVVFLLAVCLVPSPGVERRISGAGVERLLAAGERRIARAEEEGALADPEATELRRQAASLRRLAENQPEAAAEASAALPARVDAAVNRRLERGADALEKAVAAWGETAASPQRDAAASREAGEEARAALAESLDRFVRGEGGPEALPPELREALASAGMGEAGPSDAFAGSSAGGGRDGGAGAEERIARELEEFARGLGERAAALGESGDDGEGGGLRSLGEALDAFEEAQSVLGGGLAPGRGGIDRGPGDAPLTFGDESEAAGARFNQRPLPAAAGMLPGELLRRERAALPDVVPVEEPRAIRRTGAGVVENVFSGDSRSTLGPARAEAAERYFRQLGEKP